MNTYALAIHGGAGTILASTMTDEKEKAYRNALQQAIQAGEKVLLQNGTAVDAVQSAVCELENNELFNAGKGAVFTHNGKHEMDAAIMDGSNLIAGAVAGVQNIKNPVLLAKAVMQYSEHVLLSGEGAMEFAKKLNIPFENDAYFYTAARYEQLQEAIKTDSITLDHTGESKTSGSKKFGTVGCVALDVFGNIAAATSTGGMTNKRYSRIGDSPIIGSGTYANNTTCAISCTGHGEFFIRAVVAYDISCLMEYKGLSLKDACNIVVNDKLKKFGGEGGLIAITTNGDIEMPFNSAGMYRAMKRKGEEIVIGIY